MKETPKYISVPTQFQVTEELDDRFTRVKITVMHDGLNYNGSNFTLEAIDKAKDSISNIPILAYIQKQDGTNEADFGGHEFEFVLQDGGLEYRYLGRPIGLIPETGNDYHIEIRDGKNYVVVYGYIWNQYANEALDILQRDQVKGQSMEILIDGGEWVNDGNGEYYNITDYRYTGLCLLGDGILPAMDGAKVELATFSKKDSFKEAIMQMSKEFKEYFASVKGGADVAESKEKEVFEADVQVDEDVKAEEVTEQQFTEAVEDAVQKEEAPQEEFEQEVHKAKKQNPPVEEDDEEGEIGAKNAKKKPNPKDAELDDEEGEQFTIEDALVKIADLQMQLNEKTKKIEELEVENKELKQFKAEVLKERHEAQAKEVIEEFRNVLEEETIEEFARKIHEFTIDELKMQLMVKLGEKALHSMPKKVRHNYEVKIPVHGQFSKKEDENKTWYDKIIEKYKK